MKKILCTLAVLLMGLGAQAWVLDDFQSDLIDSSLIDRKFQAKISEVGFKLLNANAIDKRVAFHYKKSDVVNAGAYIATQRRIVIYRGFLKFMDSDDELASILAHEISHIQDSHDGVMRGLLYPLTNTFTTMQYEYKADKRAIDYMVKAGYNPLAFITIMNKAAGQHRYDVPLFSSHPLTSRRLMSAYEYIYTKYPSYLASSEYKNNIYYQNFLLVSQKDRAKLQQKSKLQNVNYKQEVK